MKVKCQLCGTKFDLELNHNICPECASYYRVDGVADHSELHSKYDQDSVHTMYSDNQSCGATFDDKLVSDKKSKKPASKVKLVIVALELLAIVFCIIWPFVGMNNSNKKLEQQRVTEKPAVVPKMIDEKIQVGDYSIEISDYYIDNKNYWKLPDNYVVYAVSYKIKQNGTTYTSLYRAVQVYLETSEGVTISPLESYDLREFMTSDRYQTMEKKLGGYIKNDGGILYFVVREDEEIYGLNFDVFRCDEEDYNYKELDTIYLMYLPDLEVE